MPNYRIEIMVNCDVHTVENIADKVNDVVKDDLGVDCAVVVIDANTDEEII